MENSTDELDKIIDIDGGLLDGDVEESCQSFLTNHPYISLKEIKKLIKKILIRRADLQDIFSSGQKPTVAMLIEIVSCITNQEDEGEDEDDEEEEEEDNDFIEIQTKRTRR